MEKSKQTSQESNFIFWTPPADFRIAMGAGNTPVEVPQIPLPLDIPLKYGDIAEADDIGRSLNAYLRQDPDCEYGEQYAELLRDAFPYYISDIGTELMVLGNRDLDSAGNRRKINFLKILALLEPENKGLLQTIGMACYDQSLMFDELAESHYHLLAAMGYLQRSLQGQHSNPTALNYLGQIAYFLGDYKACQRYWQGVVDILADGPARSQLQKRIEAARNNEVPSRPLISGLADIALAIKRFEHGDFTEARSLLETLEQEGDLVRELPFAEFYVLLGRCRVETGAEDEAAAAFQRAIELNEKLASLIPEGVRNNSCSCGGHH